MKFLFPSTFPTQSFEKISRFKGSFLELFAIIGYEEDCLSLFEVEVEFHSLPPECNTHVVVLDELRTEIETMTNDEYVQTTSNCEESVKENLVLASFSDNAVIPFMIKNPNGSNLLQQDLEQIHEDDLEAMD
ncbi:hypothetical protein Tco_1054872 [Tanacetum coccineum]|uniref:Reverse transcriptase domain-containing protein n=1 Tax=Tanacetum coccineum TaxID=301880 RepID=A0ABQ5GYR7_9ASTR